MRSRIFPFALLFVGAVLAQLLLFDNIQLFGAISPYPYIIFILLLPPSTNRSISVALGFLLGFTVDIFSSTLGLHAAACTLIAFLQPLVVRSGGTTQNTSSDEIPSLHTRGFIRTLELTLLLVLVHHLLLFLLAVPSWSHFGYVLLKILATVLFSTSCILFADVFLFSRPKN